jgi:hypothetical protein
MSPSLLPSLHRGPSCSQYLLQTCDAVSAVLNVSCRPVQRFQQLQNLTILIVNLVASRMRLNNCRCFHELLRMLLQSLRAHCKAPGRAWEPQEVHTSAGECCRSVQEACVWHASQLTFADDGGCNRASLEMHFEAMIERDDQQQL